ncbi:MAG: hypothetical protein KA764_18955 [Anaerolineales bacterium]|nr:hypothetical protein [Anaerolineales bacterium]
MRTSVSRRWLAVCVSLILAALACVRAELPISPADSQITPPAGGAEATAPAAPTPAGGSGYPAPAETTDTPALAVPTLAAPTGYPVLEAPTATAVIQPPPTDTPAPTETPPPTDTLAPLPTVPPITNTPIRVVTATSPASPTPAAPTASANPTASGAVTPTGPLPLPSGSQSIQAFTVSNAGGVVVGRPQDLRDEREDTWASLRGGPAAWVFTLDAPATLVGVRLFAQRDGSDPTTLTKIEVSADGSAWTTVYLGQGNCGVPNCDELPQKVYTEIGFGAQPGQFVRVTGGPTRFAFGEVQMAVLP